MANRRIVVAGIGTDVGKTVASAVICRALGADYWKPVASGSEDGPVDHQIMETLLLGSDLQIHPPALCFKKALSPHIAATLEGQRIELSQIVEPKTNRDLVIELAGGVAVPLNDTATNLDLISQWQYPVVVVSKHYLGSINHTLLTLEALRSRQIEVLGLLFNGLELPDTERIISKLSQGVPVLGNIQPLDMVNSDSVAKVALQLKDGIAAAI